MGKEQLVISKIIKSFSNEKILLQHGVLGYTIDLSFSENKLSIEVNDKEHTDTDKKKKKMKEEKK